MEGFHSIQAPENFSIEVGFESPHFPNNLNICKKIDKMDRIRQGFKQLEDAGWSDLIDERWKEDVIKELKNVPEITEDEIEEILSVVLW